MLQAWGGADQMALFCEHRGGWHGNKPLVVIETRLVRYISWSIGNYTRHERELSTQIVVLKITKYVEYTHII